MIIVGAGLGGPHSWAVRLKERMTDRPVHIVCAYGPGGIVTAPDFSYETAEELAAWLRSIGPAIVLPNWVWEAYGTCAELRRDGLDLRVVAYCRSDSEVNYYTPLVEHQHEYDWIFAVSGQCHAVMSARLPHLADRIRYLRTFVHRDETLERSWSTRPLRVLYSGRLEQEDKRVHDLPPLADGLLRSGIDFTLTLAGVGTEVPVLLDRFAAIPHAGRVRLIGSIAPPQMPAVYRDHDVLIQPSSTEGLSNSLLEAMSAGIVPVATRIGSGVPEVIDDGRNALTVEVGDVDAMVSAIVELSASTARLERMGRAAHASTEDFGWARYRERFGDLLRAVEAG